MAQPSTSAAVATNVTAGAYGIEACDLAFLRKLQARLTNPYELTYADRQAAAMSLEVVISRIEACPLLRIGEPVHQPQARSVL